MAGQTELLLKKELEALKKYADTKGVKLMPIDGVTFIAQGLPAKGGDSYSLHVECKDYPIKPPVFRWCNPETLELESPKDTPKGSGGYFHGCGTPCAPWNLNSYKQYQDKAPHGDWNAEGWQNNPKTGECKTIPRMIVKMCTELQSDRYAGRVANA